MFTHHYVRLFDRESSRDVTREVFQSRRDAYYARHDSEDTYNEEYEAEFVDMIAIYSESKIDNVTMQDFLKTVVLFAKDAEIKLFESSDSDFLLSRLMRFIFEMSEILAAYRVVVIEVEFDTKESFWRYNAENSIFDE